jgi:hypothetical protein
MSVCEVVSSSSSGEDGFEERVGVHSVNACSIAWEVVSSSARNTLAFVISPAASASSSDFLKDNRCERRWMIGQRSVERPKSVSTEFSGELKNGCSSGKGVAVGCDVVLGEVPSDRAAITS